MKIKLVALTLIAFACWLVPYKTLAEEIGTSKQTEVINPPTNEPNPHPLSADAGQHQTDKPPSNDLPSIRPQLSRPPQMGNRAYSGRDYSKEEVKALIKDYSEQYGISADLPLAVANCESGFNQFSKNKSSTASGGISNWAASKSCWNK